MPKKIDIVDLENLPESIMIHSYGETIDKPLKIHRTEQSALYDLPALLQLIDQEKLRITGKEGNPTKTCINTIRNNLFNGDFYPDDIDTDHEYDVQMGVAGIRPFAWIKLLLVTKLARNTNGKLLLTRLGKQALKKPAHETVAMMWKKWIETGAFHEMRRIDIIKGQKSKKRPLFLASIGRAAIAQTLTEMNEGKWISFDEFCRYTIAAGHNFDIVRNGWGLYISDQRYGNFGDNNATWNHLNGRFTRVFLLEYAATLGLIDVALVPPWGAVTDQYDLWGADNLTCLSRYDGLYAIRLNSLGSWILHQKKNYQPSFHDNPAIRILPNLEIITTDENLPSADKLFLDRICDPVGERTWRLELQNILQAIEDGINMDDLIHFLKTRNQGELPQSVNVFLQDCNARVGMCQRIGDAVLIKCQDEMLSHLIVGDISLSKLCIQAGTKYLVVLKENEPKFNKALRKLGYVINK